MRRIIGFFTLVIFVTLLVWSGIETIVAISHNKKQDQKPIERSRMPNTQGDHKTRMSPTELRDGKHNYMRRYVWGYSTNNPGETRTIPNTQGEFTLNNFHEKTLSRGELVKFIANPEEMLMLRGSDELVIFIDNSDEYQILPHNKWHTIRCSEISIRIFDEWTFLQIGSSKEKEKTGNGK